MISHIKMPKDLDRGSLRFTGISFTEGWVIFVLCSLKSLTFSKSSQPKEGFFTAWESEVFSSLMLLEDFYKMPQKSNLLGRKKMLNLQVIAYIQCLVNRGLKKGKKYL